MKSFSSITNAVYILLMTSLMASPLSAGAETALTVIKHNEAQAPKANDNLLPLEGGSNFRDMGGYKTTDGKTVRRGLLYRSGVMTGLTEEDQKHLQGISFDTVVDLRSREELELYPNHWAHNSGINYLNHDYGLTELVTTSHGGDASILYRQMPYILKPQLRIYFSQLIAGNVPLVVNCSAGQDRTGIASALLLSALGVPREVVIEDYLLSTKYRRPQIERGSVDLEAAARTNAFAALTLKSLEKETTSAAPLLTGDGTAYLEFALAQIEADYDSVTAYLEQELNVSPEDIIRLKQQYLE